MWKTTTTTKKANLIRICVSNEGEMEVFFSILERKENYLGI